MAEHAELMAALEAIESIATETRDDVKKINGRLRGVETKTAALEATCEERGRCAQKAGFVLNWKMAILLAVSILVAGALMGTETAKAIAGAVR